MEVAGQKAHVSSTAPMTTTKSQPSLLPAQTVCGYDKVGWKNVGCIPVHQAIFKWH